MPTVQEQIDLFLAEPVIGVVGASRSRQKYGWLVFDALRRAGYEAIPVNPNAPDIDGVPTVADVSGLPGSDRAIVIITPPDVTEQVVDLAIARGTTHIWMQPGSESTAAISAATASGANVLSGGPSILVALKARKSG